MKYFKTFFKRRLSFKFFIHTNILSNAVLFNISLNNLNFLSCQELTFEGAKEIIYHFMYLYAFVIKKRGFIKREREILTLLISIWLLKHYRIGKLTDSVMYNFFYMVFFERFIYQLYKYIKITAATPIQNKTKKIIDGRLDSFAKVLYSHPPRVPPKNQPIAMGKNANP